MTKRAHLLRDTMNHKIKRNQLFRVADMDLAKRFLEFNDLIAYYLVHTIMPNSVEFLLMQKKTEVCLSFLFF